MMRDTGLRRTTLLTGALVAASVAGTIAVGVAAYAAESDSTTSPDSGTTPDSGSAATDPGPTSESWPSLSDDSGSSGSGSSGSGSSGSGQATSGGS